jgi:sorting nexin-25
MDGASTSQNKHSLRDVLSNPSSLSYFMEFMDRRNRSSLVQFWLHVESFKNPLESVESGDDSGDEEALKTPGFAGVSSTVKEDMQGIYEMYFSNPSSSSTLLRVVNGRHVDSVKEFVLHTEAPTGQQERRVRRSVLLAQRQVEKEMEEDFADFVRSDLWFRAMGDMEPKKDTRPPLVHRQSAPAVPSHPASPEPDQSAFNSNLRTKSKAGHHPTFILTAPGMQRADTAPIQSPEAIGADGSPISHRTPQPPKTPTNLDLLLGAEEGDKDDNRTPLFADKPTSEEEERMEAIQAALTDIIADEKRYSERPQSMAESEGRHNRMISQDHDNAEEVERNGRRKRMFDDGDEYDEEEQEAIEDENARAASSFEPALPGDLQLSYDIAKLTEKITKLQSQEAILDTLIRKAELTGDGQELRLLSKSKSAMSRELRTLTFQRAQYEEQEAENRLVPDRTRVAIRNCNTVEEDGKQVVRYLIEVQQLAVDGTFASGWIVARRYNEFFTMHQRLREKYVAVRSLDFPGKRLVTSMSSSFVDARRVGLEKYMQVRSRS